MHRIKHFVEQMNLGGPSTELCNVILLGLQHWKVGSPSTGCIYAGPCVVLETG